MVETYFLAAFFVELSVLVFSFVPAESFASVDDDSFLDDSLLGESPFELSPDEDEDEDEPAVPDFLA
jgi:hypothetical protein